MSGTEKRKPKLFQFGIMTALLFMAAFGVWTSWYLSKTEAARIRRQLPDLKDAARELDIADPTLFAVSKRLEQWFGEKRWRIYLPEGARYKVCLATTNIGASKKFPQAQKEIELGPGRYEGELRIIHEGDHDEVEFLLDNEVVMSVIEPSDWSWKHGINRSTFDPLDVSSQHPTDKPLQLTRTRFMFGTSGGGAIMPTEPCNGILIWIKQVDH